jgi:hypothetical protein
MEQCSVGRLQPAADCLISADLVVDRSALSPRFASYLAPRHLVERSWAVERSDLERLAHRGPAPGLNRTPQMLNMPLREEGKLRMRRRATRARGAPRVRTRHVRDDETALPYGAVVAGEVSSPQGA